MYLFNIFEFQSVFLIRQKQTTFRIFKSGTFDDFDLAKFELLNN